MERRSFGKTGLMVSPLTMGGMRFLHGWDAPHDQLPDDSLENVRAILEAGLGAGINLLETARAYGKSERLIGQVMPQLSRPREGWMIMTKARPTATAGEMRQALEESLQRLGVDHVALFAIHGINNRADLALSLRVCLPVLEEAKRQGLLTAIGFSSHGTTPLIVEAIETGAFEFVNLHYNLFMRRNEAAVAAAAARGMGVMVISPNDKGGGLYQPSPRLLGLTRPLPPVVVNERWLLSRPGVTTLSLGLSEVEHLEIHLTAVAAGWGVAEGAALSRLTAAADVDVRQGCGVCTACLPCPRLIDIPEVLRLAHLAAVFGMHPFSRERYGQFQPDDPWVRGAKAVVCDHCGDCLPRCPRGLAIVPLLAAAHKELAG